jgi:flagellar protein FliS
MKSNVIELSYQKSAIEGASPIGLVIALYDTLTTDLRRAASAIQHDNIEARCAALNHATLVLGQLEDWIDKTNGGELARNLTHFYAYLRAKFLEASIKKSAPLLETQIELIAQLRTAWQQRDTISPPPAPTARLALCLISLCTGSPHSPPLTPFSR